MLVTLEGIVTLVSPLQLENAEFSMLVTLSGIVILVRMLQPENAEKPMLVTFSPMETVSAYSMFGIELFSSFPLISPFQGGRPLITVYTTLVYFLYFAFIHSTMSIDGFPRKTFVTIFSFFLLEFYECSIYELFEIDVPRHYCISFSSPLLSPLVEDIYALLVIAS